MFDFLEKKKRSQPKDLVFKSNQAAFEYACSFLDTSLENENYVLGIVLGVGNDTYCVKFSNAIDSSVPTETIDELLVKKPFDKNICFSALKIDAVSDVNVGDLVMYMALAELASMGTGYMGGLIMSKVQPIYGYEDGYGGWLNI